MLAWALKEEKGDMFRVQGNEDTRVTRAINDKAAHCPQPLPGEVSTLAPLQCHPMRCDGRQRRPRAAEHHGRGDSQKINLHAHHAQPAHP
jgi:hypothetical protein